MQLGKASSMLYTRVPSYSLWTIHHQCICTLMPASKYGIGAYLCQLINGKEVPIAFISKTLTQSQQDKWSVPQKEGYAIYYALCKLEHLLLDREFIIHTDHKNLTYINDSVNAMVVRWKLYLKEYTFKIQFIK